MNTWTMPSILLPLLFFYFNLSFSLQLSSLSLLFLFHTQDITSSKLPNARSAKFQLSSVDIPASNFLKGQKWCAMLANIFVISVNSIYIYTKSRVSIRLDPFSSLFFFLLSFFFPFCRAHRGLKRDSRIRTRPEDRKSIRPVRS